jgi:hypothetical protein
VGKDVPIRQIRLLGGRVNWRKRARGIIVCHSFAVSLPFFGLERFGMNVLRVVENGVLPDF